MRSLSAGAARFVTVGSIASAFVGGCNVLLDIAEVPLVRDDAGRRDEASVPGPTEDGRAGSRPTIVGLLGMLFLPVHGFEVAEIRKTFRVESDPPTTWPLDVTAMSDPWLDVTIVAGGTLGEYELVIRNVPNLARPGRVSFDVQVRTEVSVKRRVDVQLSDEGLRLDTAFGDGGAVELPSGTIDSLVGLQDGGILVTRRVGPSTFAHVVAASGNSVSDVPSLSVGPGLVARAGRLYFVEPRSGPDNVIRCVIGEAPAFPACPDYGDAGIVEGTGARDLLGISHLAGNVYYRTDPNTVRVLTDGGGANLAYEISGSDGGTFLLMTHQEAVVSLQPSGTVLWFNRDAGLSATFDGGVTGTGGGLVAEVPQSSTPLSTDPLLAIAKDATVVLLDRAGKLLPKFGDGGVATLNAPSGIRALAVEPTGKTFVPAAMVDGRPRLVPLHELGLSDVRYTVMPATVPAVQDVEGLWIEDAASAYLVVKGMNGAVVVLHFKQ